MNHIDPQRKDTIFLLSFTLFLIVASISCAPQKSDLIPIGKLKHRHAKDIKSSPISVGGETLDRDYADYNEYKNYLGPLGAKKIRLQAGWAKTEQEKGTYDWDWLDRIIDDAIDQGVSPWLQTSYGNPIYEGGGGINLGGGLPNSEEALKAWDNWVRAMAERYKGKVRVWEVWNEGDLGKNKNPEGYVELFIRTAEIIRDVIPDARLYALSLALVSQTDYAKLFLDTLKQRDKLDLVDEITIHGYVSNPSTVYPKLEPLQKLVKSYDPRILIHQGERGAPSTFLTSGALKNYPWTETSQAKWALRNLLGDLGNGYQTLYFQMVDMNYGENTTTHIKKVNTKGLLRTNKDNEVLYAKPSYFAVQNLCAVFDSTFLHLPVPSYEVTSDSSLSVYHFRQQDTNYEFVAIWMDQSVPSDTIQKTNVQLSLQGVDIQTPVLVDLYDGMVYEIPEGLITENGQSLLLDNIALYDSPVLIAEKALITIEQ